MKIEYYLGSSGFTVGDKDTGLTAYAGQTTIDYSKARKNPLRVARKMLLEQKEFNYESRIIFDYINWDRIRYKTYKNHAG